LGDHAVVSKEIFGGTYQFVVHDLPQHGIEFTLVEKLEDYEAAIQKNTKVIYIESPSNPLLSVIDIKAIGDLGKKYNIVTMIDNTFATPINQRPHELGIDVIIHSATKYLNGHSDLCCGIIATSKSLYQNILKTQKMFGGSLGPLECFLLERGMKTLALRVKQQNATALELAKWLKDQPIIKKVYYPGLESHPGHLLAKQQMNGNFGGMLSVEFNCSKEEVMKLAKSLRIFSLTLSLGGLESIICFPAESSHASFSKPEREALGISDTLVRFSVGIEDVNDLIADLKQAFQSV